MPNKIDSYRQTQTQAAVELAAKADDLRRGAEALAAVVPPTDAAIIADYVTEALAGELLDFLRLTQRFCALDGNGESGFKKAIDAAMAKFGARFDPVKVATLNAAVSDFQNNGAFEAAKMLQAARDVLPASVVL